LEGIIKKKKYITRKIVTHLSKPDEEFVIGDKNLNNGLVNQMVVKKEDF
jgi:hypothetical protein